MVLRAEWFPYIFGDAIIADFYLFTFLYVRFNKFTCEPETFE